MVQRRVRRLPVLVSVAALTALGAGISTQQANAATQSFAFVGEPENYKVPADVCAVKVVASGGEGGIVSGAEETHGLGGRVTATLTVTPGETLVVEVGGRGGDGGASSPGAGGSGGTDGGDATPTDSESIDGAGGGGSSDVRRGGSGLANRVVVAAGGGGAGAYGADPISSGGAGGGASGGTPNGDGGNGGGETPGQGGDVGTTSAPGAGGSGGGGGGSGQAGDTGGVGNGGNGGGEGNSATNGGGGGGGGAGYHGGGGGGGTSNLASAGTSGGGGGGANFAVANATGVTKAAGVQSNDGTITITPLGNACDQEPPAVAPAADEVTDTPRLTG
ncbi:MAG: hypothetical protein QOG53_1495 [Frankiales bacterium]|jgi:hypothetical protein|nr:hypothetical protein [Frankiales bacterium]